MIPLLTGRPRAPQTCTPPWRDYISLMKVLKAVPPFQLFICFSLFNACNLSSCSSNITSLKGVHRQRYKVGMTRFELATPRPPDVCATGLRYIPKKFISVKYLLIPLFFILLSNIIAALLSGTMNL